MPIRETQLTSPITLFEVKDGVATLTLNDTRRMNPLTPALLGGCLEALARVHADPSIRVLVVQANGKGFCSGADLSEIDPATATLEPGETAGDRVHALMKDFGHPWLEGVKALEVPVIAAVHGAVAGGGVGFALASDLVVAARSSYFYLPFVPALGLVPDLGAAWVMQRAIGEQRAMAMSLLGDRLAAEDAERIGLVFKCVDDDQLQPEVGKLAARLALLPPHGITELRALMRKARESQLPEFLDYERGRQRDLIDGECFAEGVAAFKQRRAPKFPDRS